MGRGGCPALRNLGGQSVHTCPIFKKSPHCVGGLIADRYILSRSNHSSHSSILTAALHNLLTGMVCLRVVSSWDLRVEHYSIRPSGGLFDLPSRTGVVGGDIWSRHHTITLTEILVARVSREGEILVSNPKNLSPKIIFVHNLYSLRP